MAPPPLPRPVDFRIFFGRSSGGIRLSSPKLLEEKTIDAHIQARDWMNANLHLDILSITCGDPSLGDSVNMTSVTVWYREA